MTMNELAQSEHFTTDTSGNLQKHINPNPLQRWLLGRFHVAAHQLMAQTSAATILDAGCGEGFAMHHLLQHSRARVVGLDNRAHALALARHFNSSHSFSVGSIFQLPFSDHSIDLVMCMEVLEHLDHPQDGLREICRVSREWLLLSVPDEPLFMGANFLRGKNVQAWGNDPEHVNHWSAREFVRFVGHSCQVVDWKRSFPWTLALCRVSS